jgi:flavodoxin
MNIFKAASTSVLLSALAAGGSVHAENSSDTLVVYFSASGNTEKVASVIAAELKADTFALKPVEPYSAEDLDYRNPESRSSREHADPSILPAYTGDVSGWGAYKKVYIGYPIWWGVAPNIVYGFVSKHDFNGKTVVTFSTSGSTGHGESGTDLAKKAAAGNWKSGADFKAGAKSEEIKDWVKSVASEQ